MARKVHRVVGMVDMGWGHMEVFGEMGLVSVVVGYIEEGIQRYIMVGVDCHEEIHHNHCLGMHHRTVVAQSILEGVVAKMVDQILVVPLIFDCPILDASLHCNLHFLQHNHNHTHSQRGENS
ncbi:hypothetical protein AHAS_Ahas02G0163000 [Arachis hypogaea]